MKIIVKGSWKKICKSCLGQSPCALRKIQYCFYSFKTLGVKMRHKPQQEEKNDKMVKTGILGQEVGLGRSSDFSTKAKHPSPRALEIFCLSISHFVCASFCLCTYVFVNLSFRIFVCFIGLSVWLLSGRLFVCPSVRLSVCLSVYLSVCPSVCLSICPSVRLSISLVRRSG